MTVREFWCDAALIPRAAIAVAALSLALNAGTYVGLRARGPLVGLYALHPVVMLLIGAQVVLFARAAAGRADAREMQAAPLPRSLLWGAGAAALYVAALFAFALAHYGEGGPEVLGGREVWVRPDGVASPLAPGEVRAFERLELRVFSAAWLFFALLVALASHRALARLRGRAALRRAAT